jgi:hypothetical protein
VYKRQGTRDLKNILRSRLRPIRTFCKFSKKRAQA